MNRSFGVFQELYDDERGGVCSFQQLDDAGRYQLESWANEDASWTVPKQLRQLLDTETNKPCVLERLAPDPDPTCTPQD